MLVSPRYEGPPIISMSGVLDDQREPVTRQRRRLEALLFDLSDDDWKVASRCTGWTVQDVVAHLVGVNAFWHGSVLAGLAGAPTRVLVGFDPAATPQRMVGAMRELTPGEVLDQFASSNQAFLDVIDTLDDDGWATLAETPAGHVPVRVLAQHALWDCLIHERDIALPLGLTASEEADEVRSSLRYAAALSPAFAVTSGHRSSPVLAVAASGPLCDFVVEIGACVEVRDDAGPPDAPRLRGAAVTLLEGLSLRVPLPAATPIEWRQVLEGLARAFDSKVPTER